MRKLYKYPDSNDLVAISYMVSFNVLDRFTFSRFEKQAYRIITNNFPEHRDLFIDIGAGRFGNTLRDFMKYFSKTIAIEADSRRCDLLADSFKNNPNLEAHCSRIQDIKPDFIARNQADLILCKYVVQHMPTYEVKDTFDKIKDLTKVGASLAFFSNFTRKPEDEFRFCLHSKDYEQAKLLTGVKQKIEKNTNKDLTFIHTDEHTFNYLASGEFSFDLCPTHYFTIPNIYQLLLPEFTVKEICFYNKHAFLFLHAVRN